MTVKVTIIGLGQVGASLGLALARHKDQVTTLGHDLLRAVEKQALQLGAVERVEHNLPSAVSGADVILLALPLDQIRATLNIIAQDLREDVVLMDTAPAKSAVALWVKEILPPNRHYIGLYPALNSAVLDQLSGGIAAARADLFQDSLVGLVAPPGTAEAALQLAAGLVTLLGGRPFYTDLEELDGLVAASQLLPGLCAAALTQTVVGQPGWNDIRKLAGQAFWAGTRPLEAVGAAGLAESAARNRANLARLLDEFMIELAALRQELADNDPQKLTAHLEALQRARQDWLTERQRNSWQSEQPARADLPSPAGVWDRQLGLLGRNLHRKKGPDGG